MTILSAVRSGSHGHTYVTAVLQRPEQGGRTMHVNEAKARSADIKVEHQQATDRMQILLDRVDKRGGRVTPNEESEFLALERRAEALSEESRTLEVPEAVAESREAAAMPTEYASSNIARDTTYPPDGSNGSYFRDLLLSQVRGDFDARDRLTRHKREVEKSVEFRDISRVDGGAGEFVPPAWLIDLYSSVPRGSRVAADLVRKVPLPGGTDSLNVPKITTGTTVAAQTADNATVSETDIVSTSVAAPVITLAGQQDVSLQLLEQSPTPGIDQILFNDLMQDLDAKLDVQVLNGTGSAGQVQGILGIVPSGSKTAYTDASATQPEFAPYLFQMLSKVTGARKQSVTGIVMHPRRWYWLTAGLDSTGRPYVLPAGQNPQNALGTVLQGGTAQGLAGYLAGVPVYIDPSVPITLTNGAGSSGTEDIVLVGRFEDAILWEGELKSRVLQEVGSGTLTTRLQVYKYCAFQANRYPTAFGTIYDTGMSSPAGFS